MYRVIGIMEDGQECCFEDCFRSLDDACQWCDDNKNNYPETRLIVEPTCAEQSFADDLE